LQQDYTQLLEAFKEILSQEALDEIARDCKFKIRESKITPRVFLDLLIYASNSNATISLNQLIIEALSKFSVEASKQAMDQRFTPEAVKFVKSVFGKLLFMRVTQSEIQQGWFAKFNRVLIKDSTKFDLYEEYAEELPGSGGSASKSGIGIQYEFDLKSGNISEVNINPSRDPDSKHTKSILSDLVEGDLVIRDLGYWILNTIRAIIERKAYVLSRLCTSVDVFVEKNGVLEKIDFAALYTHMKSCGIERIEKNVIVGKKEKLPLRLLIELMPEDKYEERIRKSNKKKKKGSALKAETKERFRFNLFVTNIKREDVSGEVISMLYKLRWQVELVFKTWKSIFNVHVYQKMNYHRWQCVLYAKLIIIVICWNMYIISRNQIHLECGRFLSLNKCMKTLKEQSKFIRDIFVKSQDEIRETIVNIASKGDVNHRFVCYCACNIC
jgi:hypothetical protein